MKKKKLKKRAHDFSIFKIHRGKLVSPNLTLKTLLKKSILLPIPKFLEMIVSSAKYMFASLLYTMIYLRYMKDQTLSIAVASLILIFFSFVAHSFLAVYHADFTDNHEELKVLLLRNFRGFQIVAILQTIGCLWYHSVIDIEKQVCKWKYGYWFTQFIGDMECGKGGRWMLYLLDIMIILMHLLSISYLSTHIEIGTVDFNVDLSCLDMDDYGILSILRMKSLDVNSTQLRITVEELNVDMGDSSNGNYGSLEIGESG